MNGEQCIALIEKCSDANMDENTFLALFVSEASKEEHDDNGICQK